MLKQLIFASIEAKAKTARGRLQANGFG